MSDPVHLPIPTKVDSYWFIKSGIATNYWDIVYVGTYMTTDSRAATWSLQLQHQVDSTVIKQHLLLISKRLISKRLIFKKLLQTQ